nr:hypothetical protein BaRGS_028810 [Batillaria attramentaria]
MGSNDTLDDPFMFEVSCLDDRLSDAEMSHMSAQGYERAAHPVFGPMSPPLLVDPELLNDFSEELVLAGDTPPELTEPSATSSRSPRLNSALPDVVLLERVFSPDLCWNNKGQPGSSKDTQGKLATKAGQSPEGRDGKGLKPVFQPRVKGGPAKEGTQGDQGEEEEEDEEEVAEEEFPVVGLMDVFQLTQTYKDNREALNSAHKRYAKLQKKTAALQQYVVQQTRELAELSRLMKLAETQGSALKDERKDLDIELQRKCDLVNLDVEGEARKFEPLIYKKYCATKTGSEARALLSIIRSRQKALHYLEAMTYRKCVSLQHNFKKGLYLHEVGHAIGLLHEHQLPNRDNYISIKLSNVAPSMRHWFSKYSPDAVDVHGVDYDYTSVMHYGKTAFSYNGEAQTIFPKDRSKDSEIGHVAFKPLAFSDVKAVNMMYKCNEHCGRVPSCQAPCFVNKDCKCFCKGDMPKPPCENKAGDSQCQEWATRGECDANSDYMHGYCTKACNVCSDSESGGTYGIYGIHSIHRIRRNDNT